MRFLRKYAFEQRKLKNARMKSNIQNIIFVETVGTCMKFKFTF